MIIRNFWAKLCNCSNNYGPKQHDEKLIPIYGDGKNIRDWLYVLDHCKGIDLVYHAGKTGDTYNIAKQRNCIDTLCGVKLWKSKE